MIVEDKKENGMEIKFNVIIDKEEYPAFDIKLELENENENENVKKEEEDVQVRPPTFDYQGIQEAEASIDLSKKIQLKIQLKIYKT